MALNLTKTYTVKSNAQADIRKAIAHGEAVAGEFTVASLSGGFRIVPHDTAAEAARWPAGTTPGLARLRANGHAEKIRKEVLADQEAASANASAAIAAASAAAMTETLAAARDAFEDVADPHLAEIAAGTDVPDEALQDQIDDAANRAEIAGIKAANAEAVTRMRPTQAERLARKPTYTHETAKAVIQRVVQTAIANGSPVIVEQRAKAAPDALSPEAVALLTAVVYSPALRDLALDDKVGKWIAYKTIHASDRPHGLNVRRVPGFMTTLARRGLVECRAEKAGQYSACVTAAGVAVLTEAGR